MSETIDLVLSGQSQYCVEHGSCLDIMRGMPDNSVDSIVTDPPYGLGKIPGAVAMLKAWLEGDVFDPGGGGFMKRKWDSFIPGPHYWREAIRVLKPGGHIVCFAATRTVDLMGLALRLSGFEIRDSIEFAYGSGFPKSKKLGEGIGNALKPAHEPIIVARKPFKGALFKNYERHGTGGLNIDDCRVAHSSPEDFAEHEAQVNAIKARGGSMEDSWKNSSDLANAEPVNVKGRWPANLLMQHSVDCVCVGSIAVKANPTWDTPNRETESTFTGKAVSNVRHAETPKDFHMQQGAPILEENIPQWQCVDGCPVKLMDEQGKENSSRFFAQFELEDFDLETDPFYYCPKPSRAERDMGLSEFKSVTRAEATSRKEGSKGSVNPRAGAGSKAGSKNVHPTVKGLQLMRYLCKLVTPKNGIVLDPFTGSGATGAAALLEGFRFIGCELNDTEKEPFVRIARARIEHVASGEYARRSVRKKLPAPKAAVGQRSMF